VKRIDSIVNLLLAFFRAFFLFIYPICPDGLIYRVHAGLRETHKFCRSEIVDVDQKARRQSERERERERNREGGTLKNARDR